MNSNMPHRGTSGKWKMCPTGTLPLGAHAGHTPAMLPNNLSSLRKAAGLSQTELAEAIGTSLNMLGKLERGERKLTSDWISRISTALNVAPFRILTPAPAENENIVTEPDLPPIRPASAGDGSIEVRQVDLSYAMGPGTNLDHYADETPVKFDANFLRRVTRAEPAALFVAQATGDSMFPTLINSDEVLIDTSQRTLNQQDRIWAVSIHGAGMIKRLRSIGKGKVRVLSDNETVPSEEVDAVDMHIVGRVIWVGRRV